MMAKALTQVENIFVVILQVITIRRVIYWGMAFLQIRVWRHGVRFEAVRVHTPFF